MTKNKEHTERVEPTRTLSKTAANHFVLTIDDVQNKSKIIKEYDREELRKIHPLIIKQRHDVNDNLRKTNDALKNIEDSGFTDEELEEFNRKVTAHAAWGKKEELIAQRDQLLKQHAQMVQELGEVERAVPEVLRKNAK